MSYISDYKVSGDYEEYRINAIQENNMERYYEKHEDEPDCSGDCSDCPVLDCEHNEREEEK